jgi:hypothetical protein
MTTSPKVVSSTPPVETDATETTGNAPKDAMYECDGPAPSSPQVSKILIELPALKCLPSTLATAHV